MMAYPAMCSAASSAGTRRARMPMTTASSPSKSAACWAQGSSGTSS